MDDKHKKQKEHDKSVIIFSKFFYALFLRIDSGNNQK